MAKKCPTLPKKLCAAQVAELAIGIEKTCEGKQEALSKLMAVLSKDVAKKRFTPERAAAVVNARARGVEGTCRLQKQRFDAAAVRAEAAKKAAEERDVNRFNGLGRARGPRGSGLGLVGVTLAGLGLAALGG